MKRFLFHLTLVTAGLAGLSAGWLSGWDNTAFKLAAWGFILSGLWAVYGRPALAAVGRIAAPGHAEIWFIIWLVRQPRWVRRLVSAVLVWAAVPFGLIEYLYRGVTSAWNDFWRDHKVFSDQVSELNRRSA